MPTFVKYNNSLNIKTWITNFERKSDSYGLDHGWKVLHLSDYLQDEALTYYFESLCNIEDWGKLKESLIIRFQKVKLTPLVEMMRITQEEQETVTEYFHRKMQLINNVELNLTSIVELLNEGVKTKYKPYLATVDAVQPSEWLTMAIKVENSLTGSGTPVEKGRLQTLNPALHPSPRPAGYYGNSQVQRRPMPCRICERLGLELQWHYHSVCPYRNPTASRSFPPPTPRVQRPTASRSFPSATPHSYQAAASSSFPPLTPHDYQPTVASASSPDSPRNNTYSCSLALAEFGQLLLRFQQGNIYSRDLPAHPIAKSITAICVTNSALIGRNFVGHLDNILKRCRWILPRLTSTIQGQFGLTFSAGRKIHNMVILPAILYGSGVWGKRVFDTNGIRKLRGLHYKYAKALIRGGPCTPTIPAISLTGCPPLDISIKSHLAYLEALREGPFESRPSPSSVPYPPLRRPLQFSKSLPERATIVYTDGSRSTNGVGAAVVLPPPYSPLKLRLHNSCTSFQAELLAILYATRSIRIMPRQDFVIASDCQAALHAICHPDIPKTPLTAEIIRNLNTLDNVQLCWVRSHCGIVGNEQADEVAKAAAQSKLPLHFATLPRKFVRSQSKQFALQLWTDLYTTDHATRNLRRVAASPSLLISILPKLKYCNVTSTILTGHGFVQADIARTSKNNDPVCQHCHQENQTVDHLLFIQPHQRVQFEDAELQALLDEDSTQMQEKLAKQLQVSQGAVSLRLNSLGMTQKLSRWVPPRVERKAAITASGNLRRAARQA
ncbi:hypothetical protein LAZ67_4000338 [Cordylochernes scorpioides]|uniref:ribonuclease H n=1 Tax=Cordylochernes scorpioides TaxID=51811 RepID=A0ABY6KD43_9ARAC|nr:hypothetical protein LAZ67_4000338 [Cordylochernes scorpioides]